MRPPVKENAWNADVESPGTTRAVADNCQSVLVRALSIHDSTRGKALRSFLHDTFLDNWPRSEIVVVLGRMWWASNRRDNCFTATRDAVVLSCVSTMPRSSLLRQPRPCALPAPIRMLPSEGVSQVTTVASHRQALSPRLTAQRTPRLLPSPRRVPS